MSRSGDMFRWHICLLIVASLFIGCATTAPRNAGSGSPTSAQQSAQALTVNGSEFGVAAERLNTTYTGMFRCETDIRTFSLDLRVNNQGAMSGTMNALHISYRTPTAEALQVQGQYDARTGGFTLNILSTKRDEGAIGFSGIILPDGKRMAALPVGVYQGHCTPLIAEQGKSFSREWSHLADEAKPGPGSPGTFASMKDRLQKQCPENIRKWVGKLGTQDMPRNIFWHRQVLNLFSDEYFVPYFNEPFHKLSRDDRANIYVSLLGSCRQDTEFTSMIAKVSGDGIAYSILVSAFINDGRPISFIDIGISSITHKVLREWRSAVMKSLSKFPDNNGDPALLDELVKIAPPLLAVLWPNELSEFKTHAEALRPTVIVRWLERTLKDDVARSSPTSNDQLLYLANYFSRHAAYLHGLSNMDNKSLREQYVAQVNTLLAASVTGHIKTLESLTPGLQALVESKAWNNEHSTYFAQFPDIPAIKPLRETLANVRRQSFKASSAMLTVEIQKAADAASVQQLTQTYLIAQDNEYQEGSEVIASIDARTKQLQIALAAQQLQANRKAEEARRRPGIVYKSRRYWTQYEDFEVAHAVFDGNFNGVTGSSAFLDYFTSYVGAYFKMCEAFLPNPRAKVTIKSKTVERKNGFDNETPLPDFDVYMDPRYEDTYRDYWERLKSQASARGFKMLGDTFQRLGSGRSMSDIILTPLAQLMNPDFQLARFIDKETCNSASVKQMGENFLRAAKHQASVQAAGVVLPGADSETDPINDDDFVFSR